jgi:hypothetical protein
VRARTRRVPATVIYMTADNIPAHEVYAIGMTLAQHTCGRSRRGRVVLCAFDAHGERAHLARLEVVAPRVGLIRPLEHP